MIGCMARTGSKKQSEKRKRRKGYRTAKTIVFLGVGAGAAAIAVGSTARYVRDATKRVILRAYGSRPK